jgi:hypothetical protein
MVEGLECLLAESHPRQHLSQLLQRRRFPLLERRSPNAKAASDRGRSVLLVATEAVPAPDEFLLMRQEGAQDLSYYLRDLLLFRKISRGQKRDNVVAVQVNLSCRDAVFPWSIVMAIAIGVSRSRHFSGDGCSADPGISLQSAFDTAVDVVLREFWQRLSPGGVEVLDGLVEPEIALLDQVIEVSALGRNVLLDRPLDVAKVGTDQSLLGVLVSGFRTPHQLTFLDSALPLE